MTAKKEYNLRTLRTNTQKVSEKFNIFDFFVEKNISFH